MLTSTVARMHRISRKVVLLLVIAVCLHFMPFAGTASAISPGTEAVQGLGSFFLTMPYGALKMTFAMMGGFAGGLGWLFTGGDLNTAKKIWDPSLGGNYVITPKHLRGEEDANFIGKIRS